jgi:hypothetical protein
LHDAVQLQLRLVRRRRGHHHCNRMRTPVRKSFYSQYGLQEMLWRLQSVHKFDMKLLSRPQGHSAAGWIRSTEKSNDLIGNRTRDLPACSIVPQPTTVLRTWNDVDVDNRDNFQLTFQGVSCRSLL